VNWVLMLALAAAVPASPARWATPAPGVEHLHVDEGNIDLFRFDLAGFRADVAVPGAGGPVTAAELRRETGAALVVNGGFFDTDGRGFSCGGPPGWPPRSARLRQPMDRQPLPTTGFNATGDGVLLRRVAKARHHLRRGTSPFAL
jgi:hypothetical protein